MNDLEKVLYRTRKSLLDGLTEVDCLKPQTPNLDTCSSCGIWEKIEKLKPDLDNNPICNECFTYYGP